MNKYWYLTLGAVAATLLAAAPRQESKPSLTRTVEVKLNYTGSGTVDSKHKIFVALWDSPDFMTGNGGAPLMGETTTSKDGTVTFTGVTKSPVYISCVYDSGGNWDGRSGPPPSGSPLGVYSTPGQPAPVDVPEGKTVRVTLTFDDSFKMP